MPPFRKSSDRGTVNWPSVLPSFLPSFTTTKCESVKYDACNMVMDGAAAVAKTRCKLEPKYQSRFLSKRTFVSLVLPLSLSLSPDRPDSTDAVSIFLTEASPPPPLSRASFTEMLSAFVFSRRTAKREASNSGEGKLSSATAFSPEGQQGNEEECPKNALKTLNAGVWRDSEHELDSWRMWAFAD